MSCRDNLGLDQENARQQNEENVTSIVIFHYQIIIIFIIVKFMWLVDLQILCGCTQAIKQDKVCKQRQLKLTHINVAILNRYVTVIYLKSLLH